MIDVDYGYANARIRGMKSRLLDRKTMDELAAKPDVNALIAELEKTPYREDIADASTRYGGIKCVEYALRRNYTRTFRKIMRIVKGEPAETYVRIFLDRWDIQNVKTILRGKSFHIPQDEVFECLVPAGDLDDVTLGEMIKQPDVKAVIDLLATWHVPYAEAAHPALQGVHRRAQPDRARERAGTGSTTGKGLEAVQREDYDESLVRDMLGRDRRGERQDRAAADPGQDRAGSTPGNT